MATRNKTPTLKRPHEPLYHLDDARAHSRSFGRHRSGSCTTGRSQNSASPAFSSLTNLTNLSWASSKSPTSSSPAPPCLKDFITQNIKHDLEHLCKSKETTAKISELADCHRLLAHRLSKVEAASKGKKPPEVEDMGESWSSFRSVDELTALQESLRAELAELRASAEGTSRRMDALAAQHGQEEGGWLVQQEQLRSAVDLMQSRLEAYGSQMETYEADRQVMRAQIAEAERNTQHVLRVIEDVKASTARVSALLVKKQEDENEALVALHSRVGDAERKSGIAAADARLLSEGVAALQDWRVELERARQRERLLLEQERERARQAERERLQQRRAAFGFGPGYGDDAGDDSEGASSGGHALDSADLRQRLQSLQGRVEELEAQAKKPPSAAPPDDRRLPGAATPNPPAGVERRLAALQERVARVEAEDRRDPGCEELQKWVQEQLVGQEGVNREMRGGALVVAKRMEWLETRVADMGETVRAVDDRAQRYQLEGRQRDHRISGLEQRLGHTGEDVARCGSRVTFMQERLGLLHATVRALAALDEAPPRGGGDVARQLRAEERELREAREQQEELQRRMVRRHAAEEAAHESAQAQHRQQMEALVEAQEAEAADRARLRRQAADLAKRAEMEQAEAERHRQRARDRGAAPLLSARDADGSGTPLTGVLSSPTDLASPAPSLSDTSPRHGSPLGPAGPPHADVALAPAPDAAGRGPTAAGRSLSPTDATPQRPPSPGAPAHSIAPATPTAAASSVVAASAAPGPQPRMTPAIAPAHGPVPVLPTAADPEPNAFAPAECVIVPRTAPAPPAAPVPIAPTASPAGAAPPVAPPSGPVAAPVAALEAPAADCPLHGSRVTEATAPLAATTAGGGSGNEPSHPERPAAGLGGSSAAAAYASQLGLGPEAQAGAQPANPDDSGSGSDLTLESDDDEPLDDEELAQRLQAAAP